ncbi:MAG: OmpA family protein [Hahellaceae bacterium]|nr:OmpA family protein [Hahellaceae bacterium]
MWCLLRRTVPSVLTVALLAACAAPQVSEPPQGNAPSELTALYSSLKAARQAEKDLIAPLSYAAVSEAYANAQATPGIDQPSLAQYGIAEFRKFELIAAEHSQKLAKVLASREKARKVRADQTHKAEFLDLDEQLRNLAKSMEQDPKTNISKWVSQLSKDYQSLELRALKYDIVEDARKAIEKARQDNIDSLAPKTLMMAEEEMLLSLSILDQNRTRQAEAREHAANALAQVAHAREIQALAQQFDESNSSYEDVLMWHEKFVGKTFSPLLPEKFVRLPDPDKLQATLENLVTRAEKAEAEVARLNQGLVDAEQREASLRLESAETLESARMEMEQQVLAAQLEADAERRRTQIQAENVARVAKMFAPTEADTFNQGDKIIIRAHGLEFRPGASEVDVANLPLVAKIISAIELFPDSRLVVAGHTDNLGDDAKNQTLSEERAANLTQMLVNIGGINPANIRSEGLGETQPVATNETSAGRSTNRRVEIHIITESGR